MKSPPPTENAQMSTSFVHSFFANLITGLRFSVSQIQRYMQDGRYAPIIAIKGAICMTATVEWMTAELVDMIAQETQKRIQDNDGKYVIKCRDIMMAVRQDDQFSSLLKNVIIPHSGLVPNIILARSLNNNKSKKVSNNKTTNVEKNKSKNEENNKSPNLENTAAEKDTIVKTRPKRRNVTFANITRFKHYIIQGIKLHMNGHENS